MSLQGPLEKHLAPPLDDARIQSIARKLRADRRPRVAMRLVPALVAMAAVIAWALLRPASEPQPIALENGAPLPATLAGRLALSDGSVVAIEPGAVAEVVANQPARLTVLLRSGRARFEVNPNAHRQWLVEAGLATVEVVGTIFSVDRSADGVRVTVERGVVVVRSDRLVDHLQRVEAGQSAFVPAEVAAAAAVAPAVVPEPAVMPVAEAPRPPEPVVPPIDRSALDLAGKGDLTGAWSQLGPDRFGKLVASSKSFEELLLLSDVARANAQPQLAAVALTRALRLSPGDATAAFMLGRLELEQLSRPDDAAGHFELASHGPLAEDAGLRRVEALVAAGHTDAALAAARDALARFPNGARAEKLERWLDDPQHAQTWLQ